jgi:O-antigen/teichoic acid export membrane protein
MEASAAVELGRARGHVTRLASFEAVNRVARFGAALVLARALDLDEFGILNVGIAVAGVALTATSLGLNDLGARDVAVEPGKAGWLAGRVVAARIAALAAICVPAIVVVAAFFPAALPVAAMTVALALAMACSADWILRGFERMGQFGTSLTLGGLTVLGGAIVIGLGSGTAVSALAVFVAGEVVASAYCWIRAGRASRPQVGLTGVRPLLRRSWPLGLSALALYGYYANLDSVIIAATRSTEEAGLYSAAYRVFLTLNAVSVFTAFAFLPILARGIAAGDDSAAMAALRVGVRLMAAYGALVLGVAEVAGGPLLEALFGDRFAGLGTVFVLLCLGMMWYATGYPLGYTLIARDRNRRFLAGATVAAATGLGLDLVLIPLFGATGAASATAAAFVAGSLTWTHAHGMLDRRLAPQIALMAALSVAAIGGLIAEVERPVGVITIATAAIWAWPALARVR